MKVIIAGSRDLGVDYTDITLISKAVLASPFHPTEVVSGTARGIDTLGEYWAAEYGKQLKQFPADWTQYGKTAGFIRNLEMAEYADALIAVWDGKSRGTQHMINSMKKLNKPVFVYIIDGEQNRKQPI